MAARKTPSAGGKPDKIIRDALMLELKREDRDEDNQKTTKLKRLIAKLVANAIEGDTSAIKEISDRVDGKPAQAIAIGGDSENPLEIIHSVATGLAKKLDRLSKT